MILLESQSEQHVKGPRGAPNAPQLSRRSRQKTEEPISNSGWARTARRPSAASPGVGRCESLTKAADPATNPRPGPRFTQWYDGCFFVVSRILNNPMHHRPSPRAPLSSRPLAAVWAGVLALVASSLLASPLVEAADGRGAEGRAKTHSGSRGAAAAAGLVRAAAVGDSASEGERARLRGELDQLNREIDALKQQRRSLGEDYALRSKMADAEAKARRLTELEGSANRSANRSGGGNGGTTAGAGGSEPRAPLRLSATPQPSAADDSDVLDAKADILADQARRVGQQADLLEHRVLSLRGRQELRRRAGELELDPFSPFEQSKRRIPIGAAASSVGASNPAGATQPVGSQMPNATLSGGGAPVSSSTGMGTRGAATNPGSGMGIVSPTSGTAVSPTSGTAVSPTSGAAVSPTSGAATAPTSGAATPATSGAAPASPGSLAAPPGAASTASGAGPPSAQPTSGATTTDTSVRGIGTVVAAGGVESTTSTSQPSGTGPASGPDAAGSLAGQFRDVLDPVTLTEIRRLEGSGGAARASLPATERALAALRARARQLQSEADAARRAAHPGPGQRP